MCCRARLFVALLRANEAFRFTALRALVAFLRAKLGFSCAALARNFVLAVPGQVPRAAVGPVQCP